MISATFFGSTQCTRERIRGDRKRVERGGGTFRGDILRGLADPSGRYAVALIGNEP